MSFSIPMLIPVIVGVVIGVSCRRLYTKIRERSADQQARSLFQMRQQRIQERRALLRDDVRIVGAVDVDSRDEILRG